MYFHLILVILINMNQLCAHFNGFKYCYLTLITQFNTYPLLAHDWIVLSNAI